VPFTPVAECYVVDQAGMVARFKKRVIARLEADVLRSRAVPPYCHLL